MPGCFWATTGLGQHDIRALACSGKLLPPPFPCQAPLCQFVDQQLQMPQLLPLWVPLVRHK